MSHAGMLGALPRDGAAPGASALALPLRRLAPYLVAAAVLVVAILTVAPWPVGVFQDDGIYVVLAKALATGEGYRMINLPGSPRATHYPPGYPLLLAALWKLSPAFPGNVVRFKFANALFLAITAACTWWFARARLGAGVLGASVGAIVGTLSIVVILITGVVLSEPMFMALLLPTLVVAERAVERGHVREALAAGALIGAVALVRTVGVFVLPGAVLLLVARREWRAAFAMTAAAAVVLAPWQLWVSLYQGEIPHPFVGKYGAYGPWLAEGYRDGGLPFALAVLGKNANELFGFVGYATLPVAPVAPRLISLAIVLLLLFVGARAVRRSAPVTLLFLALYVGVVLVWPFEPSRFAIVLLPLLVPLFGRGLRGVVEWAPRGISGAAGRYALFAGALLVIAGYATYNARGYGARWWASIQRDVALEAGPFAEWAAAATEPGDVLVADHDLIIYLYAGRQAVPTGAFTAIGRVRPAERDDNVAVLREILAAYRPRYYAAATAQSVAAAEVLAAEQPPRLRRVGGYRSIHIFEPVSR